MVVEGTVVVGGGDDRTPPSLLPKPPFVFSNNSKQDDGGGGRRSSRHWATRNAVVRDVLGAAYPDAPLEPAALRALLERDPAARREVEYRMMKQVAFELYERHGDAAVQAFLDRADNETRDPHRDCVVVGCCHAQCCTLAHEVGLPGFASCCFRAAS